MRDARGERGSVAEMGEEAVGCRAMGPICASRGIVREAQRMGVKPDWSACKYVGHRGCGRVFIHPKSKRKC